MDVSSGTDVLQTRWVVQHIQRDTVRRAKTMAVEHGMLVAEVLETAVNDLWRRIYDQGDLPEGWHEY